jgi:hypothetical protein
MRAVRNIRNKKRPMTANNPPGQFGGMNYREQ